MRRYLLILLFAALFNTGYSQGPLGQAFKFDGVSDYFDIQNLELEDTFTIEFWANPSNTSTQNFIGKHALDGSNIFLLGFYSGSLHVRVRDQTINTVVPFTGWHHVAVAVNSNEVKVYYDSELVGTLPLTNPIGFSPLNERKWVLGMDWDSNNRTDHFEGYMDEFRIWNDERTEEEIIENRYREINRNSEDLELYYNFNMGSISDHFGYVRSGNTCNNPVPIPYVRVAYREELSGNFLGTSEVQSEVHNDVDLDWGTGGPIGVRSDNFTADFDGTFVAPVTGTYTFYTFSDDGVRLFMAGDEGSGFCNSPDINQWVNQSPTEHQTMDPIYLQAGKPYKFDLEYYEAGGGARVRLQYSVAGEYSKRNLLAYPNLFDLTGNENNGIIYNYNTQFLDAYNFNDPFIISTPSITRVAPEYAAPGATIKIYGSNFQATDNVYVKIGGEYAEIQSSSGGLLEVVVPENLVITGYRKPVSIAVISEGIAVRNNALEILSVPNSKSVFQENINVIDFASTQVDISNLNRLAYSDFDNDGDLDLIATNGTEDPGDLKALTFLNVDGNGTFEFQDELVLESGVGTIQSADVAAVGSTVFYISTTGEFKIYTLRYELFFDDYIWNNFSTLNDPDYTTLLNNLASYRPHALLVDDVDGDGNRDLIFSSENGANPGIYWVKMNNNGIVNGTINTITTRSTLENAGNQRTFPNYFKTGDIDNDGTIDVIAAVSQPSLGGNLYAFLNSGNGTFTERNISNLSGNNTHIFSVVTGDINNDGQLDIVTTRGGEPDGGASGILEIWENNNMVFNSYELPNSSNEWEYVSELADVDGDGFLDLLSFDNLSVILRKSNYANGVGFQGAEVINNSSSKGIRQLKSADINSDGTMDLIIASQFDSKLSWIPNKFGPITRIHPNSAVAGEKVRIYTSTILPNLQNNTVLFNGTQGIIDAELSSTNSLVVTVPEIEPGVVEVQLQSVSGIISTIQNANFTVIKAPSPKTSFLDIPFNNIDNNLSISGSAYGDLDNDGDLDLITINKLGEIKLYENDQTAFRYTDVKLSIPEFAYSTQTYNYPNYFKTNILEIADINNDNYNDIVTDSYIFYSTNGNFDNASRFYAEDLSDEGQYEFTDLNKLAVADLNHDGFSDLVGTTGIRFSGDTKIVKWDRGVRAIEIASIPNYISDIKTWDMDSDGDLDIVIAIPNWGSIQWLENTDGFNTPISPSDFKVVSNAMEGVNTIALGDINNDGHQDVVAATGILFRSSVFNSVTVKIGWFANTSEGTFTLENEVDFIRDNSAFGITDIHLNDIDGDSDLDILASGISPVAGLYAYQNINNGDYQRVNNWNIINTEYYNVEVFDADNDGDLDIIAGGNNALKYFNNREIGNDIVVFTHAKGTGPAIINTTTKTVEMEVDNSAVMETLTPVVEFSEAATGVASSTNFSSPVTYVITSETGQTATWTATVTKIPDAPVLLVSDTTQTTATITWDAPNFAVGYEVEVSTDPFFGGGFLDGFDPKIISNAALTSGELTDLEPGTRYYVRARAVNKFGSESEYSERAIVFTKPDTPVLNPIQVTDLTPTTASISWSAVSGIVVGYIVELTKETDGEVSIVDGFPILVKATSLTLGQDFSLNPLNTGAVYGVSVKALNGAGESPSSNTENFLTLPEKPELALVEGSLTESSLSLSWPPVHGAEYYLLTASSDDFESFLDGFAALKVLDPDTTIGNLEPGIGYQVRLRAVNTSGSSDPSDPIRLVMKPATPTLQSIDLNNITTSSAEISWDPVPGNFNRYIAEVSSTDFSVANTPVEGYPLELTGNDLTLGRDFSVPQLTPGTWYWVRVKASNNGGESGYSNIENFITIPNAPSLTISGNLTGSGVDVTWDPVTGADFYNLEVSRDNFQTLVGEFSPLEVTGSSYSIEGLESGTNYEVRLSAGNTTGLSGYSVEEAFLTLPESPLAREASSVTPLTFTANWDPVDDVDGYHLEVSSDNFQTLLFNQTYTNANPVLISELEAGNTYEYRIRSYNTSGESDNSNIIELTTANPDPLTINVSFDEVLSQASTSSTINVNVNGGFGDRTVEVRMREISQRTWNQWQFISETTFGVYDFSITADMLDEIGLEFEIKVTDELGTTIEETENFIFWYIESENSASIPFAKFGGTADDWQMFSIPYILDDNLIESIFDELGNQEYSTEWRLSHYQNTGGNGTFVDFGEGINRIELGKGYWFNAKEQFNVRVGAGSVNSEIPFTISLQQGWNQIGNPYNIPISWSRILLDNGNPSGIDNMYMYTGSGYLQNNILDPFEGAFVWSDNSSDLKIDPSEVLASGRVEEEYSHPIQSADIDDQEWYIPLQINLIGKEVTLGGIGMHADASAKKDVFDKMLIPRFNRFTDLHSRVDGYFYPFFSTDIQPSKDEHTWNISLETNEISSDQLLTWDNTEIENANSGLFLYDKLSGKLIDMRKRNSYPVNVTEGKFSFDVYFTKNPEAIVPDNDLILGNPFPNPSSDFTVLPVTFPATQPQWEVAMQIIDVNGKVIKTLLNNSVKSGYHEIQWNLNAANGVKAAKGLYFVQLRIKDYEGGMFYKKITVK